MSEAVNREPFPEDDEDLKRAVVESLDALDREGKLAVLKFSWGLEKEGQTERREEKRDPAEVAEGFRRLVEGWMAEDPAYDREAWPELKKGLDRNRSEYRKHFSEQVEDEPKAAEG